MTVVFEDDLSVVHHADARDLMPSMEGLVVTDPPFNIGFDYGRGRSDRMREADYLAMLAVTCRAPSVVIHRPEMMFMVAEALGQRPTRCVAWVYNANTPRQWRMLAWFGVDPDFSLVRQPYKNLNDRRIKALVAAGSTGTALYDWWNIQQVKNVTRGKTRFPCQMPQPVMDRILRITPSEVVIDPFLGSGSTLVAARALGRRGIGIEKDAEWAELSASVLRPAP